ncbi:hypothetical protein SAMN05880582_11088 [Rhizobium sp. RU20A]|uniref:hypothetical protein n=1 Tax=Rhizobium sp. RU20A TaxID=1907412 RepID=UPI000956BD9A|nr:hypothetical protein [Rhizobium sp. RU20A]SIR33508.1 hypothetical protein SAMN05880582_11088 [Rhizobium sp. RU20A]
MKSPMVFTAMVMLLTASPAVAAKTVETDGLVAVALDVRNDGAAPILCQAEIAHWFATDLARVAPGETASLGLHVNTHSGTWAAMNTAGEALPVERAWCGVEGHTYETRFDLGLKSGKPPARQLTCRAEGKRLACR